MDAVDTLVKALREAPHGDRGSFKDELIALAKGPDGSAVQEHLDNLKRGELLETQWEIEEVLEAAAPPPPEPEPEPEAETETETETETEDPNRELTAADLNLVYDDPRGLMLHKSKVGDRWFLTQMDPRTQQPQTFELHQQEIEQLKTQLQGSPYWVISS
jgi:hypothetical protein